MGEELTFGSLRAANLTRCEEVFHPIVDWSPTDWMTAAAGELGEAANQIKKARRTDFFHLDCVSDSCVETDLSPLSRRQRIGEELADTLIYIDLLATRLDLNLADEVRRKFNIVSEEKGSKVRI